MAANLKRVTASGAAASGAKRLHSFCLTAAAATSTATVDDSTDGSGTDLMKLSAVANTSVCWTSGQKEGVPFGTAIYVTLTGASAEAAVEYD